MGEATLRRLLILAGSLLLLAVTLVPLLWMLVVSLAERPEEVAAGTGGWSLAHYREVLGSPSLHFLDYLGNSLLVSLATAVLASLGAALAAYAVSRLRFPGRVALPLLILALSMFPQISLVGALFSWFARLGLINTAWALLFPYIAWTMPLALWINLSTFAQIPRTLDEAALVDGADRLTTLRRVILPLAAPGFFSSFLLVFVACCNEFLFALLLTVDHTAQTLPVGLALFQGLHGEMPWGQIMAAAALATLPLALLVVLCQRAIVQGLLAGAVKE